MAGRFFSVCVWNHRTSACLLPICNGIRHSLFGASYLDVAATPAHWNYHTFNYYINITIFPWLEIGYTCTLHKAEHGSTYFPPSVWGNIVTRTDSFQGGCVYGRKGGGKNGLLRLYWARNDPSTNDILEILIKMIMALVE